MFARPFSNSSAKKAREKCELEAAVAKKKSEVPKAKVTLGQT